MSRCTARPVTAADLPLLQPWLPPGADTALPADPAEGWWLAGQGGRPQACLRLRGPIGLRHPRPWYHVGCVVHAAPALGLYHRQATLQLGHDHTGASELADLAMAPGLDASTQSQLLQALLGAALALLAAQRAAHAEVLIVELPGLPGEDGAAAPFWQGLGRHFHAGDPWAVARRHGPHWREHLAALLPRQPVYAAFLPAAAQAAIGQTAPAARACLQGLNDAGWRYSHHITIVDGGPVLAAHVDSLLAARPL